MYSPKISEDLIPVLYRRARHKGIPMTELVDSIIRPALEDDNLLNKEVKNENSSQNHQTAFSQDTRL